MKPLHLVSGRMLTGAACAVFVWIAATGAGAQATRSANDGVISEAQIKRGEELFQKRCTACHEPNRFSGEVFLETWVGKPVFELWDVMRTTMPEDNPGTLSEQQYADIVGYFLSLNGFPAAAHDLKGTEEAMREVRIDPPRAGSSAGL